MHIGLAMQTTYAMEESNKVGQLATGLPSGERSPGFDYPRPENIWAVFTVCEERSVSVWYDQKTV